MSFKTGYSAQKDYPKKIAELKAGPRWIPVSDGLPEVPEGYGVDVIAVNMNDKDPYAFSVFYDKSGGFEYLNVTHWIDLHKWISELPLPPEAE